MTDTPQTWLAVAGPGDYVRLLPVADASGPDVFVKLTDYQALERRLDELTVTPLPLFADGKATDAGRALLPERFIAQLEAMLNDDQELMLDRTPLLATPASEVDLPDLTWPTAEQMLSSPPPYASGQPAGTLFTAEPRGPVEPGADHTPGV